MPDIDVRVIDPADYPAWFEALETAFFVWGRNDHEATAALRREKVDLTRVRGAYEGATITGTFRSFGSELTVPGGGTIPAGAVTAVTVRPTHRRRGILTAMVAADLRASVELGEVASVLIAAEYPIYGRFGYGHATNRANWTVRTRAARLVGEATGSVEILEPAAALPILPGIFERYRRSQPGEVLLPDYHWGLELGLEDWSPNPRFKGFVAVHRDAGGEPDAYARYHGDEKWDEGIPDNVLVLDELHAATPEAEREMWRYLTSMDLIATIKASSRSVADPLPWWLTDARAARITAIDDHLWVRILDVERALSARTYESDGVLIVEVADVLSGQAGPAAGRYRLVARDGVGSCERTTAEPDLTLTVRALGSAYLGGIRLVDAGRSGGIVGHHPGTLLAADRLFRTAATPWCSTFF